jgi:hypothetical protein
MSFIGTARRREPFDGWFCGPYLTATFFAHAVGGAPRTPRFRRPTASIAAH